MRKGENGYGICNIRAKEVEVLSSEVVRIKEEVGRQTFR